MAINPTQMPGAASTPAPSADALTDQLDLGMKQYPVLSKALKTEQQAGEKAVEAKVQAESLAAKEQAKAKREQLEKYQERVKTDVSELEKQEQPMPEFKPSQENALELGAIFSMIATVGVGLGGSGKLSGLNALNAMGGMLKGYQSGKKDVFEKEQKIYEKEVARIKAANDNLEKKINRYLQLSATEKEAAYLLGQEIVAENPGVVAANMNAGKADVVQKIAAKNTEILKSIFEKSMKTGLTGLTGKGRDAAVSGIQGVRSINNLERQLDDPEVQIGLRAKVAPFFEKLTSGANSKKDFETAVNETLTGTDKTTLFLKDALLETYAIERAAKNGQRLTVQDMKMVGPVLDPTNYKPETYRALLESRRRSLYNNLQDQGLSVDEITKLSAEHPYEPYSSKSTTASPTSNVAKLSDIKHTAEVNNLTVEEVKKRLRDKGMKIEGEQ